VNPATEAVARAYAEILRRRGKRSYVVVPGPRRDGPRAAVVNQPSRGLAAEQDQDAVADGELRRAV
jgi:hypothetical protein